MGIYTEKAVNKTFTGSVWYCPLCDSHFATEEAFNVHQIILADGWQCLSALERIAAGMERTYTNSTTGVWSIVKVPAAISRTRRKAIKT